MADMTRSEQLLNAIATGEPSGCAAMTRREKFLAYLAGECDAPPSKAFTREEKLLAKICENGPGGGGGGDDAEPGKPYIDSSKMTSFTRLFYNGANLEILDDIDTSNGTDFSYTFYGASQLKAVPQLDTSKGTKFSYMFGSCAALETIPLFNTSNGTDFSNMFYGATFLKSIPQLNINKGTNFASTFGNCKYLETVSLTTAKSNLSTSTFQNCTALKNITIGEGWAVSIYLNYSNNLTVESLHGMIENLADLTGQTAKTFQIGATNLAKIDEAHIAMLNAKNWEYS